MSEDMRPWNDLNLGARDEEAIDAEQHQTILDVANKALENGHRDPEQVLRVAKSVRRRAHMVENLRAYATRAMLRIKDSVGLAQAKEEPLENFEFAPELIDVSQVERIENKILIRELLETLKPLDREIFTRHMRGDTCPEIDADMGLKPRTAEIRFAFCKNALRKAFMDKLDRKNCARGC